MRLPQAMVARGPDHTPRVVECDENGYLIFSQADAILAALGLIEQTGLPQYTGTPRYVDPTGDNSNGLTEATAYHSISTAMADCIPRDVINVTGGCIYNENATLNGLVCNVDMVLVRSVGPPATITNTDINPDGAATHITADDVKLENFTISKGEVASLRGVAARFSGALNSRLHECIVTVGNAATHLGVQYTNGALGCGMTSRDHVHSAVVGAGVGTTVDFDDATRCFLSKTGFGVATTGTRFSGAALLCSLGPDCLIQNCTTGISLEPGAMLNILSASILSTVTPISDLSGNATNVRSGSPAALHESVSHIPQFAGTIYVVNGTTGLDTNNGRSPATAFQTIGQAISAMASGDAVVIRTGVYAENGLALTLDGLEMWCEIGTRIEPPGASTGLLVSGDHCRVHGPHVNTPGQISFQVTGDGCSMERCHGVGSIAFDIDGDDNDVLGCVSHTPTVTGFDVSGDKNRLHNGSVTGDGSATRGYLLSGNAAYNTIRDSDSVGSATAGFEAEIGTSYNTVAYSTSGGGDGPTVDDGQYNNWPGYIDQLATEQHEDIYPLSNGQGAAGDPITVSNNTTDGAGGTRNDQNFWGDIVRVVPPDTFVTRWSFIGVYIHATTAIDVQQYEILFTYANRVSAQNGGNDWDKNETVLTITNGSLFENGDLVWVVGADRPEGEVMIVSGAPAGNVVTLARETTADADTGLRYDYDATGVGNKMYLIRRSGVPLYEGYEGDFSAPGGRYHERYQWHEPKQIAPDGGMLIRMLNATDAGVSEFDVRAIYED